MDMGFVLTQSISQAIGVTAIIYLLATMGLNIQFGYMLGQGTQTAPVWLSR